MENKINVAEILKDCPKGMELDCTLYENVEFDYIEQSPELAYPIHCITKTNGGYNALVFTHNGCNDRHPNAKCVIFPKGKTTWEGFVPPCEFKDGDVLFVDCSDDEEDKLYQYIFILNKPEFKGKWNAYCHLDGVGDFYSQETYLTDEEYHPRFATEEEKKKLFDSIKSNGYKWNDETKTLEKLVEPEFKVGDMIRYKRGNKVKRIIVSINNKEEFYHTDNEGRVYFKHQDDWELVPNKFDITTLKPFDKVLVRNHEKDEWQPNFFNKYYKEIKQFKLIGICIPSYCNVEHHVDYCIPYEGNEHLLGTTNDCDDFYKTWE